MPLPHIIIITGPTASGKSAWAIRLAQAIGGELVNADARQVYRGMDIGTNKDLGTPVHLVDIKNPNERISVGEYQALAYQVIDDIIARGKVPILVGGTGLYIRAVTEGVVFPPASTNDAIRSQVEFMPLADVHRALQESDPAFFARSDSHNAQRARRALEVFLQTGVPQSAWMGRREPRYTCHLFAPELERATLYERINSRVETMLANGWQQEVRNLLAHGIPKNAPAMTGIGYSELAQLEDGALSLSQATRLIQARTRAYARRQYTWFRAVHNIRWLRTYEELENCVRINLSLTFSNTFYGHRTRIRPT